MGKNSIKENVKQNVNDGMSNIFASRELLNAKRSEAKKAGKPPTADGKPGGGKPTNSGKPPIGRKSGAASVSKIERERQAEAPLEQPAPESNPVIDLSADQQNRRGDAAAARKAERTERLTDMRLYSLTEIEDIIGVTHRTLLSYVKDKRLKASMVGGKWKVTEASLRSFIKGDG